MDSGSEPESSTGERVTRTAAPADPGGITIFTALQQQLGLRLDPRTSASDYFVVTRAELPSAN